MADKREESSVKILSWPKESAKIAHQFDFEKPCPVSVSFDETPVNVIIQTDPQKPLNVNMDMRVSAKEPFPVCIKLCEPVCARSDYAIGLTIFDRFVAAISVRGETKLLNCGEDVIPETVCVDFQKFKSDIQITAPFTHENLTFTPLGDQIRTSTIGDPPGQVKLAFPREGVRMDFPGLASDIKLTVNNYAGPTLDFSVYAGAVLLSQFTETVANEVREINITQTGVTAIEVKGGDNEASIIEICYALMRR